MNKNQTKLFAQLSIFGRYDGAIEQPKEKEKKYYRIVKMESIDIVEVETITPYIADKNMNNYFFQWTPPLPGTYHLTVNLG
jgi:hypothetical protein